MAEQATKIIGVDFSGNGRENTTWVTEAELYQNGHLQIQSCSHLSRKRKKAHKKLEKLLKGLPDGAVAAMDFPFSVPRAFAKELSPGSYTMPDVWCATAKIKSYGEFKNLQESFVKRYGAMMRRGDIHFGGPLSPLQTAGVNMLSMTFYGIQMLHRLWESKETRFRVPPLPEGKRTGPMLLETMPGVLLRGLDLPAINYKDRTKDTAKVAAAKKVRCKILDGLERNSGLSLNIPEGYRKKCIEKDDCLDSLVAAVGAAMWVRGKPKFLRPLEVVKPELEIQAAQLEGWIYAPQPLPKQQKGLG